ncbi:isopentenyl-diphosphate Delta-isomerase [Naasia aerilata]|uniref:Isopentenyl-diphosphate Delta-isomerase n=1 Tax=Naasia aerilata TaxID=1162966 RepID=A0ABM8GAT1_9MICO|nr:isopentenyl-diphosphate Delta-isomerase [Naasia aerilata]BDZ45325.1 isopentenyl-diphosphate Delta-isomerase [Naasia aerilata]
MAQPEELVVLLDDDGHPVGSAPKATVHTTDTPLHLAFSCHVRDDAGRILVTRRALGKRTWPGVWTNSFCGHPAPGEDVTEAVIRRARQELGIELDGLRLVLPEFRYRAVDASGVVEHELCPVYIATVRGDVLPDPDEVMDWAWADEEPLESAVRSTPWAFSPWLALQLPALADARLI